MGAIGSYFRHIWNYYRSCLDRVTTDYRRTIGCHIDQLSAEFRLSVDRVSTDYRPSVERYIDRYIDRYLSRHYPQYTTSEISALLCRQISLRKPIRISLETSKRCSMLCKHSVV